MNGLQNDESIKDSKEKAEILLRAALSKKAQKPILIRLSELTTLADYFLIVSARSTRQVKAVAEAVRIDARRNGLRRLSSEGIEQGNWALLDYGDVVVHIFYTPVREFYDLEGLWAEAPREEFPEDILQEIDNMEDDVEDDDDWDSF
ncbi:ribosome silencing factor [Thermodesulfobacteriota bacterium]